MLACNRTSVCGYEFLEEIGRGSSALVRLCFNRQKREYAAVKILPNSLQLDERKALAKEIDIHHAISHQNIIKFILATEDTENIYIVLEWGGGGELFHRIAPDIGVEENLAHLYFLQICSGVEYLHGLGVAHRDLKPENLLLDIDGNLKISDFGLATVYRAMNKTRVLTKPCGTLPYIAPEILKCSYSGPRVDVWSAGIVLYVLLAGNTPWAEPRNTDEEFALYIEQYPDPRFGPWQDFPDAVLELLIGILNVNETERLTLDDIKSKEWFKRPNPLIENGKCQDPVKVAEIMRNKLEEVGESVSTPNIPISLSQPEFSKQDTRWTQHSDISTSFQYSQQCESIGRQFSTQGAKTFCDVLPDCLTRFYTEFSVEYVSKKIRNIFEEFSISYKHSSSRRKISFVTVDKRKCPLQGDVHIVDFAQGILMVAFQKRKGDPLEFKRLFKAVREGCSDLVVNV